MQFTSFLSVRLWVAAFLLISASQYHILAGDDVDQNRSVTFSNDQSSNEFSRRIFNTLDSLRKLHVVHRPLFLTPIRNDGVGAIILHMLYSAAYADIRGWAFAGVVRIDSRHCKCDVKALPNHFLI